MNSKQRVLATIDHIEPDRVPADLWALSPVTDNLRVHFGVDDPSKGFPPRSLSRAESRGSGQAGHGDEAVWQALGIDLRSVWPAYVGPPLPTFDDGSWRDWWGLCKCMIVWLSSNTNR